MKYGERTGYDVGEWVEVRGRKFDWARVEEIQSTEIGPLYTLRYASGETMVGASPESMKPAPMRSTTKKGDST